MHIPDNFLSPPVWATLDALAIPATAIASRKAQQTTDANRLPMLGVMGAFVFAAQTINFPVGVGTSGHLVGGTLLACLLGPWAAALVVTAILIIQALLFQDGGVLALGANVINMALIGVLAGYLPARLLYKTQWKRAGVFLGGTCSVMASGMLALAELLISGIRMPGFLISLSLGVFAVNALVEGAITVAVLQAIQKVNPGVAAIESGAANNLNWSQPWQRAVALVAILSIALAAGGVLVASTLPDGLEGIAKHLGMAFGGAHFYHSPVSDYQIHGLGTGWVSRAGAGLLGLVAIYGVCALGGHLLARSRRSYS